MSISKILDCAYITPKSGKVKNMVIFLHGYGSNGDDLLSIGDEWESGLPDTVFLSPNAPDDCDESPMGYQWFSIRAIDRDMFERERQIHAAVPKLDDFIDEQLARWEVDISNLVVVGFSQGAMMAMYTMPRREKACAGVIGYSGMLIDAKGLQDPSVVKPRVLAIHGDSDDVVDPASLAEVASGFSAAGFDIEAIMRPRLAHGIDKFGLVRGMEFCKEVLADNE